MDVSIALAILLEFLVLIVVFGALLAYAIVRGRRALIALILGLYVALLISLKFPYYDQIFSSAAGASTTMLTILVFAVFTGIGTFLFERLLADEYDDEPALSGVAKKATVALLGTVLVMAYSYHVLPVTALLDPGASVGALFAPEQYFFWFLIIPLVGLFFV